MKYFSLLLIILFSSHDGFSQPAYFSLGMNKSIPVALGQADGSLASNKRQVYNIIPVIGYYHYLNKDISWGVELSMNFQGYREELLMYIKSGDQVNDDYELKDKWLSINFSASKHYSFKQYLAFLSAQLSFTKSRIKQTEENIIISRPGYTLEKDVLYTYPNMYYAGLYFVPSLYRKIYKRLYLGAGLKLGIITEYATGKDNYKVKQYENGILTASAHTTQQHNVITIRLDDKPVFFVSTLFLIHKN